MKRSTTDTKKQDTGCCCDCCSIEQPSGDSGANKKVSWIRFIFGGLLFIAALLFEFNILPAIFLANGTIAFNLVICVVAYLLVALDVIVRVFRNIGKSTIFDENFLMMIATFGAFAIGEYPEAVAVMLFYQIGELFESAAVRKSRSSIAALMDIRPDYANVLQGSGEIRTVKPADVAVGALIVVRPGEKVPLDGIVVDGLSALDTSALSGESLPRDVAAGSDVLSGSINKTGLLTIQVTKAAGESTVAKILEMVQNAGEKKAAVEKFISRFARVYTPIIVIAAVLLAAVPPLLLANAEFSDWLYRALVFLVVSCPCALVVSVPLSFFGGIGSASRQGILIKGSNYLEALTKINTIVFDKTGTLTKGTFRVTEITALGGMTKDEILFYASHVEAFSNHPAAACVSGAYSAGIDKAAITGLEEIAGCGVRAFVNTKRVLAGNKKLLEREGISYIPEKLKENGGINIYIAVENILEGCITIADEIKQDAAAAIAGLKKLGIEKTIMLSGDTEHEAAIIAKLAGVDTYFAGLLPHQKVEQLEAIYAANNNSGIVAFVGDGINDAPVLARADVGIAMGALGSDAAIEAADVVLMNDAPSSICTAVKLSRKTQAIVRQNIVLALGTKALILALGAAGIASIWLAVVGDVGVLFLAVLNAMRTMKR